MASLKNGLFYFGVGEFPKDTEMEEALKADEKPCYYKVGYYDHQRIIKQYKPSVAKLLEERTGKIFEKIG